jgi:NO-binding membrane sensor protein with MHYT domain
MSSPVQASRLVRRLQAGLRVRSVWFSLAVSLIMGVAVTGMHYTGMAAMHVYMGGSGMTTMSAYPADRATEP